MIKAMLVVVLAAANLTGGGPPDPTTWIGYPCPSGGFALAAVSVAPDPEHPDVYRVTVPGSLPCGVPESGPRFGTAVFPEAGGGFIDPEAELLGYATPTGPTPFRLLGGMATGTKVGLCLMTDLTTRLACLWVVADLAGARVTALPVDAPEVAAPVAVVPGWISPSCATCWNLVGPDNGTG